MNICEFIFLCSYSFLNFFFAYAVTVSNFFRIFYLCSYIFFFLPELILHKFSVEGYSLKKFTIQQQQQQASIPRVPLFCGTFSTMDPSGQPSSTAQRRKQRRLRSWWRHEQQSIAAALATFTHHSALREQKKARAGEEESEVHNTAEVRKTLPPQPEFFSLYEDEHRGKRPPSLAEPPGPQGGGPEAHHGAVWRTRSHGAGAGYRSAQDHPRGHPGASPGRWGAAGGTAGGSASAFLPRLCRQGDVVVGRFGTVLGCRWLRMVPLLWGLGALLVAVGHTAHPVDPGGLTASPARSKYWEGLRRDALD